MSFFTKFCREVAAAGLPVDSGAGEVITSSNVGFLPAPAQRYLRFMGVVGRHQEWSFRAGFRGRFRTKPGQSWMKCQTWQYNHRAPVARIFHIRIRFGGILTVIARDTYIGGRGRMLVRLMDLFPIADAAGEEFDTGESVTYLNDAVLLCPTMLFVPEISWAAVDDQSFVLSMRDHGQTVTARVFVNADGAPTLFSTTDRFCYNPDAPKKLIRARWTTPVAGWQTIGGRHIPTRAEAVWHLRGGAFTYADFTPIPESLAFNL